MQSNTRPAIMRCSHCQSIMFEAEIVTEGQTEQTLFECPTCGRTHLYSRRRSALETRGYRNGRPVERRPRAAALAD